MERRSNHHSPRVDDELAHEIESLTRGAPVESRSEEARSIEGEGDGEPVPDARTVESEIEQRSLLAMSLRPSAFPADRARLLDVAEAEHAHPEVMAWLRSLPGDGDFANVQEVWSALGGSVERRQHEVAGASEEPHIGEPAAVSDDAARPQTIAGRAIELGVGAVGTAIGLGVSIVRGVRRIIRR